MTLIDRYIDEVVRRLPASDREEIGRELRSTMEDLLPVGYSEMEERELLRRFGDPAKLAGKYRARPKYLIGPQFFELYLIFIRLIIPIGIAAAVGIAIFTAIFTGGGETPLGTVIGSLIGGTIGAAFDVVLHAFFWVTLFFVTLEAVDRFNRASGKPPIVLPEKDWTPEELTVAPVIPGKKAIPWSEPAFDLFWSALWVSVYFNANKLIGIYEGSAEGPQMAASAFNEDVLLSYWPLVVFALFLQVVLDGWKWLRKHWDMRIAIMNTVSQTVAAGTFFLIFSNRNVFSESFLLRFETSFGTLRALDWIIEGIIFTVAVFALVDVFQGFRKAALGKEESIKNWKIRKG